MYTLILFVHLWPVLLLFLSHWAIDIWCSTIPIPLPKFLVNPSHNSNYFWRLTVWKCNKNTDNERREGRLKHRQRDNLFTRWPNNNSNSQRMRIVTAHKPTAQGNISIVKSQKLTTVHQMHTQRESHCAS